MSRTLNSRRHFLRSASGMLALLVAPAALARMTNRDERVLRFHNLHTGENLDATYWAGGDYVPEQLAALDNLLRDHRTGQVTKMDRKLYDLLFVLQQEVGRSGTYHVISGYRSPRTNAMLNKTTTGVAKRSLHTRGKAIDIRLPGTDLKHLREAALRLKAGGVGYYPDSNFIHVDTGRPRFW
ncbi:DUF882 domain-containing protein [Thiohalophilus thiocyanatoxydans]|uniref:Murein endopeptidase K n=1 Tax=Thiohalophilus thiocyanatoxydans TaxID=381308 RepID=A0A4R8ITG8_9GAMM|nr:DUF882 domain-containing protein [Thiohalophilus thiocyanatoxydans]TDY04352.1 uncharacterized protein YcbK (DUF882 family) [Thiohalophilus thiocyanatoxydans]